MHIVNLLSAFKVMKRELWFCRAKMAVLLHLYKTCPMKASDRLQEAHNACMTPYAGKFGSRKPAANAAHVAAVHRWERPDCS